MRKLENLLLSRRVFCTLLVLFSLVLLFPMLYIGKYNHASGDCYWFAFWVHCAWANTHSLWEVFTSALDTVIHFWQTWQGTYSSVFFFSISPLAFGEQYLFVVPYMMIGMTCFSTFFLLYALLKKLLHFDTASYLAIATITSLMQFEFMYTPASGLYWYNGAVHYVFMQGFINLTLALHVLLFISIYKSNRFTLATGIYVLLAGISGFLASGANFSTALLNAELAVLLELIALFLWRSQKKKGYLLNTVPFVCSIAGFILCVAAPGNAVRQAHFQQCSPFKAIGLSFTYSASQAVEWITIYVVIFLLMLLPFILKAVTKTVFKFPCLLLMILGCYCLYASMFTPGFYSFGGSEPLSRNQNICKMFLLLCLVLCEIYTAGWFVKKCSFSKHIIPSHGRNILPWTLFLSILSVVFISSFVRLDNVAKQDEFISFGAYEALRSGNAERYHAEYLIRLNEYKNNPADVIYVNPYSVAPYPLWVSLDTETTSAENGVLNNELAEWYGKTQIIEK